MLFMQWSLKLASNRISWWIKFHRKSRFMFHRQCQEGEVCRIVLAEVEFYPNANTHLMIFVWLWEQICCSMIHVSKIGQPLV